MLNRCIFRTARCQNCDVDESRNRLSFGVQLYPFLSVPPRLIAYQALATNLPNPVILGSPTICSWQICIRLRSALGFPPLLCINHRWSVDTIYLCYHLEIWKINEYFLLENFLKRFLDFIVKRVGDCFLFPL